MDDSSSKSGTSGGNTEKSSRSTAKSRNSTLKRGSRLLKKHSEKAVKAMKSAGRRHKSETSARTKKSANLSASWEHLTDSIPPTETISNMDPVSSATPKVERPKPHEGLVHWYVWHSSRVRLFAASKRAPQQLAVLKEGRLTLYHIKGAKGREENNVNWAQDLIEYNIYVKKKTSKIGIRIPNGKPGIILRIEKNDFDEWCSHLEAHKRWRMTNDFAGVDPSVLSLRQGSSSSLMIQMDQAEEMKILWKALDLDIREARQLVANTAKQLKEHEDSRVLLKKVAEVMNNNRVKSALVHFQQTLDDANRAHDTMTTALDKIGKLRKEMKERYKQVMTLTPAVPPMDYDDTPSMTHREREDDCKSTDDLSDEENTQSERERDPPGGPTPPPSPAPSAVAPISVPVATAKPAPAPIPTPPPQVAALPPPPPEPVALLKIERRKTLKGKAPPMPYGLTMAYAAARSGTLPIEMFQPLSTLQLFAEDLAHSSLLDKAVMETDMTERMSLVAAFAVSCYANTAHQTRKPFNPVLGETFEWDRWDDLGWRYHSEQIDHGPDISACAAVGKTGWRWSLCADIPRPAKRIWASSLDIAWKAPMNGVRVTINGEEYRWNKVTTACVSPISWDRYVRHHGDMTITCTNGYKAVISFPVPKTQLYDSDPRVIHGKIFWQDDAKNPIVTLSGSWSGEILRHRKSTGDTKTIFSVTPITSMTHRQDVFSMSEMGVQANEMTSDLIDRPPADTDSRFRPDMAAVENGDFTEATNQKVIIEQNMRDRKTVRDKAKLSWVPIWFKASYVANDAKKSTRKEPQWWLTKDTYWTKKDQKFNNVPVPQFW